jgi:hypothetical protein
MELQFNSKEILNCLNGAFRGNRHTRFRTYHYLIKRKVGHIQSEKASLVAGVIMIAFLFVGEKILRVIGIDVNSFAVAGAFVLFLLGLEMILGINIFGEDAPETASVLFRLLFH